MFVAFQPTASCGSTTSCRLMFLVLLTVCSLISILGLFPQYSLVRHDVKKQTVNTSVSPVHQSVSGDSDERDKTREAKSARVSRFNTPSVHIPHIRTPSLEESRHRVLYSSISSTATDGLGHSTAALNGELYTALKLNLTYTHRVATYGSLTAADPDAIENFFGWGAGEIPRAAIQSGVCDIRESPIDRLYGSEPASQLAPGVRAAACPRCRGLRGSRTKDIVSVRQIVELPPSVSFPHVRDGCKGGESREECLARYVEKHRDVSNAVFAMSPQGCDALRAYSLFDETGPWFYWKYWRRHGGKDTRGIDLLEDELSIAVHARRGDFLDTRNKRTPTASKVFIDVIKQVADIVQNRKGRFARMPVHVYIYSEGTYKEGYRSGHDLQTMTDEFVDIDGTPQDAEWWIARLGTGFRADLRISVDTLSAAHQMASADVFIGSSSGLSINVIRSIGRGVLIMPCPLRMPSEATRLTCYDIDSGELDKQALAEHWSKYDKEFASV